MQLIITLSRPKKERVVITMGKVSDPNPPYPANADISRYVSILSGVLIILIIILAGCTNDKGVSPRPLDSGSFTIEARYSKIRSYRGGGGVFIVHMEPDDNFTGDIELSVMADSALNARLSTDMLNRQTRIAEITIRPGQSIEIKAHVIELAVIHSDSTRMLIFDVELYQWTSGNVGDAIAKRNEILAWLDDEHPEYDDLSTQEWFAYFTYPEIWVVEHWTFLNLEWEMRLCFHVMIPPHDWSMLQIRKRGETEPVLAARRESDGTVYEIAVSEYPTMFGY
jgi:hypothetical protein